MDMGIDKARRCIGPLSIEFLNAAVRTDPGDLIPADGNVRPADRPSKDIDHFAVFNDQIRFDLTPGRLNQLFEFFFCLDR